MMMIIKGILLNVITVGSQLSSFYNVHQSSLCRGRSDHILQENWASGLVGGRSYFAEKLYWNFTEVNLQQPCSENIFNERF